jgi:signal transduction histidine kinase
MWKKSGARHWKCYLNRLKPEKEEKLMKMLQWPDWKTWPRIITVQAPDEVHQAMRIRFMELYIALPVKGMAIGMLFYYFVLSSWFHEVTVTLDEDLEVTGWKVALDFVRRFFLLYVVLNVAVTSILLGMRQLPLAWVQQVVFTSAWVDALFFSALTAVTGGYDSFLYWVFLGLIVRNAISTPVLQRQLALNLIVTVCYLGAGMIEALMKRWDATMLDETIWMALYQDSESAGTEPFLLRLSLLLLMTVFCYGVQMLLDKQRVEEEAAREFDKRQEQLQATGRLAAEIAHQLKNPLGIINNASYTLQKTVREGKTITQQIQMIREEVERSDRILTELMGYARLTEGRVEKLNVTEELDRAIDEVFPPAADFKVKVERDYAPALPLLMAQQGHLSEVFVNLLQNAREAMEGYGVIVVRARYGEDYSVVVSITDNGPGIPPDKLPSIFEPYFTTKTKGTGLGLAIVKHNTEIYGGTVGVESELGLGTTFTVKLPAKALMKLRK